MAMMETHLTSAAAFVEGGVQESCDDACSICLEAFCDSDPSTVTGCKHEYHLQCILEWCQRSSQCPMCWQPISLKDPISQELLEAVEQERSIRSNQTRNTAIFHHPTLGDFELQHLPVGASNSELEERIIQHLAAAAAMGRAHHIARREGRGRSGIQGRQQFLVFSAHPNAVSNGAASANSSHRDGEAVSAAFVASASSPLTATGEEILHQIQQVNPAQAEQIAVSPSGVRIPATDTPVNNRIPTGQSTPLTQDRAGSSDLQSFSDSLKSRLNAVSMRYKESITKSTRGWKEKLFARSNSVSDIGSEVRREVNAGIATVSRMMERLDSRDGRRTSGTSSPQNTECHPVTEPSNERAVTPTLPSGSNTPTSCAGSNTPTSCATISGEN